jgi:hypothetical protein
MNPEASRKTNPDTIDRILAAEEELVPSSGFLAATMDRVREEAAMPAPIPFPWKRALPGIVVTAAVLGWSGLELARTGLSAQQVPSFTQLHLTAAGRELEPAAWVALALVASLLSWLFSRRMVGRSGLL